MNRPSRSIVVRVRNHQREVPVGPYLRHRPIHRAVREALRQERQLPAPRVEVSVALVDEPTIARLNGRYRGLPLPTDVLSFSLVDGEGELPAEQAGEALLLGEVVISVPRAVRQARALGHSVERELAYLAVHGCLHLLGYDHEDGRARRVMRAREEAALGACGLGR